MDAAEVASSPDVGSSRNNAIGAAASSIPILTRFLCPPEMTGAAGLPTSEFLTCERFRQEIKMSTCCCISLSDQLQGSRIRAECKMFSRTVSSGNTMSS